MAQITESKFNSEEYGWKDLRVAIGGRPVKGIRGLRYKTMRTTEHIYAAGTEPHSRYKGNKEYSGEVTLLQSELEALIEAAQALGYNDLTDVTVNIIAAYARTVTDRIKTDTLENVDFEEFEKGMQQNDPNMEIVIPVKIGRIRYNT